MSGRRQAYTHNQPLLDAIGRRLYVNRLRTGRTQQEVSEQTGIHRSALSDIERGKRTVDAVELILLAQAYDRPVEDLLPARTTWPTSGTPTEAASATTSD